VLEDMSLCSYRVENNKTSFNSILKYLFMVDNFSALCGSRKYPKPHHRGSLEILRRRGVLKAKIFN